jgi:uncharacterized membrane protein
MRFEDEIVIDAPAGDVWRVYSDVERWPEWTASVTGVEYVDGQSLAVGARARVRQPKLPVAVWEVTAIEPGRSWTWVARAPGVRTTAVHIVEPLDNGLTRVRMALEPRGLLGAIVGRAYARLTRSYLAMEAAGLKQRCEAHAAA